VINRMWLQKVKDPSAQNALLAQWSNFFCPIIRISFCCYVFSFLVVLVKSSVFAQ